MEYDFQDGNGLVPARKHPNGGGWVSNTARVSATAYVSKNAWVYGDAWVYGNAQVFGNAQVYGDAHVCGNAQVFGNACVFGNAQVFGDAWVYGNAQVFGNAQVSGNARVNFGNFPKAPVCILRSDGYAFTLQEGGRVVAGCRDFSKDEAYEHWGNPEHHMHKESMAIINALYTIQEARAD